MKHRNNRGPKTVPWGTPESTCMESDDAPSRITCCVRWVRNTSIQSYKLLRMPYLCSFFIKRPWGTVSKALEKSNMAMSVRIPRSWDERRSWIVSISWVSQEWPARNPC